MSDPSYENSQTYPRGLHSHSNQTGGYGAAAVGIVFAILLLAVALFHVTATVTH